MNGVSAVLITKNERGVIERCIKSLAGLDQIVVVDTGSVDGTMDIAIGLGADAFEFRVDPFHFGQARNAAMMRARNRWVLSIDADEVLRPGSVAPLLEAVKNTSISAYQLGYEDRSVEGGSVMLSAKARLFQKGRWIWRYRVHERLAPAAAGQKVARLLECVLEHHPLPNKEARREQNLELLKLCVEEDPDYLFAARQLGLEYVLREDWASAIPYLERHVKRSVDPSEAPFERVASRMHLAKCIARTGDLGRAMSQFQLASHEAPMRREPLYWAALECLMAAQPWNAIPWLERCVKVPPDDMPEFSLYSKEIQGDLPATTLLDCQTMIDEAKARYEAQKGRAS